MSCHIFEKGVLVIYSCLSIQCLTCYIVAVYKCFSLLCSCVLKYHHVIFYEILFYLCAEHHHEHHSHDHTHDPGVTSVSIVCEGTLDLEKVWTIIILSCLWHALYSRFLSDIERSAINKNKLTLHFQANMWLGTLLLERSEDIYRMKGLLSVQGMDERFVFQVILVPL